MGIVLKVSKPNIDVTTARPLDLGFSSEYTHPKIWKSGIISGTSQNVSHPFTYPIQFSGYIKQAGPKYFPMYNLQPFVTYGMENSNYGTITVSKTQLRLAVDSANKLVWIGYVESADPSPQTGSFVNPDRGVFRMSENQIDVRAAMDRNLSLTSGFQTTNIVQQGEVTVSVGVLGPTSGTLEDTTVVDVTHKLGYAAHVIIFNDYERGGINYYPAPIGLMAPYCAISSEIMIDESKIRFRVSRHAEGSIFFGDAECAAADYKFKYFLTNYKLP